MAAVWATCWWLVQEKLPCHSTNWVNCQYTGPVTCWVSSEYSVFTECWHRTPKHHHFTVTLLTWMRPHSSCQWGSVEVGRFAGWMTHGFHPPGRYIIYSANRRHLVCLGCNVHCRLCCVFSNLWENESWRFLSQVCPDSVNQNIISISILGVP